LISERQVVSKRKGEERGNAKKERKDSGTGHADLLLGLKYSYIF
jgi:hypothetical protein